jgi:hypothetical protein
MGTQRPANTNDQIKPTSRQSQPMEMAYNLKNKCHGTVNTVYSFAAINHMAAQGPDVAVPESGAVGVQF